MIFAPSVTNVFAIKVNVMDRSSQISFGSIQQADIFLSTKRNQGFGEQNGDLAPVNFPVNIVNDPDLSESNSVKNSVV